MPNSPRCVRVIAARRWRACGRWRPDRPRWGWSARMRGLVSPGRCSCTPVRVRSGRGWAGSCWPMSRRSPRRWPSWSRMFVAQAGFSLQQVLAGGEPVTGIDRIQPVLVGMQLALTALWRSYGVEPDAVIGHSMGEVTAAVVAGALTRAEGLQVIATRSRLMARLSGQGAMALLELDAADTEALIAEHPQVTVAVYASPRQTVIAGPPEQIDALIAVVAGRGPAGAPHRRRCGLASSDHRPDAARTACGAGRVGAGRAQPSRSSPPSTVHGPTPAFDAEHWAANLRNPVRFSQAIATAGQHHATFIEISPHPLLTYAIKDILAGTHHHSIGTLQRDVDETLTFHTNLNATHTAAPPRTPHPPEPHPPIPTTPWHHTHHWIGATEHRPTLTHDGMDSQAVGAFAVSVHPLLGVHVRLPEEPERHAWQGEVGTAALPWLSRPPGPRCAGLSRRLPTVRWRWPRLAQRSATRPRSATFRFEQMLLLDEQTPVTAVASIDAPGVAAFAVQTDDAGETSPARGRGPACGRGRAPAGAPRSRRSAGRAPGHGQWRGDPAVAGRAGHRVRSGLHRSDPRAYRGGRRTRCWPKSGRLPVSGPSSPPTASTPRCWMPASSPWAHTCWSARRRSAGGLLLPLSVGRLRRFGAGRDARYCHVTVTKADTDGDRGGPRGVGRKRRGGPRGQPGCGWAAALARAATVNGCSPTGC